MQSWQSLRAVNRESSGNSSRTFLPLIDPEKTESKKPTPAAKISPGGSLKSGDTLALTGWAHADSLRTSSAPRGQGMGCKIENIYRKFCEK